MRNPQMTQIAPMPHARRDIAIPSAASGQALAMSPARAGMPAPQLPPRDALSRIVYRRFPGDDEIVLDQPPVTPRVGPNGVRPGGQHRWPTRQGQDAPLHKQECLCHPRGIAIPGDAVSGIAILAMSSARAEMPAPRQPRVTHSPVSFIGGLPCEDETILTNFAEGGVTSRRGRAASSTWHRHSFGKLRTSSGNVSCAGRDARATTTAPVTHFPVSSFGGPSHEDETILTNRRSRRV